MDVALPGIVYPVKLKSYEMPNELGSYIFWSNHARFSGSPEKLVLDCKELGIHNCMDLMDLCSVKDAAEYIIYKGIFKDAASRSGYGSSGLSSWSSAGSSSSDMSDYEGDGHD